MEFKNFNTASLCCYLNDVTFQNNSVEKYTKHIRVARSIRSIFIIPLDDVELYLQCGDYEWSNESVNEKELQMFSDSCTGIYIGFYVNQDGRFLFLIPDQKGKMEEPLTIYFERIYGEKISMAFFDKDSLNFDEFEIFSGVAQMSVGVRSDNGIMEVQWQEKQDSINMDKILNAIETTAYFRKLCNKAEDLMNSMQIELEEFDENYKAIINRLEAMDKSTKEKKEIKKSTIMEEAISKNSIQKRKPDGESDMDENA